MTPPQGAAEGSRVGRMAGRTALITGSTGIAEASAELFAAAGARVFVVSRTEGHCRELVDGLVASGAEAAWYVADLEDEHLADDAVAAAVDRFGRLDALFNVAGGSGRRFGDGPVHEMTMEGWERTMSLNARTHVTTSRAVLRRMLDQAPDADGSRGAILNMASILAFSPVPGLFPTHAYAASKGAIVTLTQSMAAFYVRHGIRVNAVAPSLTTSRMSVRAAADAATQEFAARRQPLSGGFLPPSDVADAALFLLSRESRSITGQVLLVDGGWSVTQG
jgi:NAD(P)-dependent dehydrogenase (short-subunit alcohol dehydrogenase family)